MPAFAPLAPPMHAVLVKKLTEKVVINGPALYFPSPFNVLSYAKRKAINLTALEVGGRAGRGRLRVL